MHRSRAADRVDTAGQVPQSHRGYQRLSVSYELGCHRLRSRIFAVPVTPSTPAWTNELLRNAVAAEVTVTSTDVSPTSTGDGYSTSSGPGRRRGRRLEVGAAEPCPRAPDSADQDTTEGLEPVAA